MKYLDYCDYKEIYEPEHVYVFTGKCVVTGKPYTVTLPAQGLFNWNQGMSVQKAFPDLSPDDREFIVSGMSPEGWNQVFPPDESEEPELNMTDAEADADVLKSAGMGTDEDYGYFGDYDMDMYED